MAFPGDPLLVRLRGRMRELADADDPNDVAYYIDAVWRVLDKCQQIRDDRCGVSGGSSLVGHAIALTFEQVVAAALGVEVPDESA